MSPSEVDMQRYFRVSPPTVHQTVNKLHANVLIARNPGKPRTIEVLIDPGDLPTKRGNESPR